MMVTRDLRKLLDNSINSEICVWVGNSKLEGLLISWNESEIVIYSESHDQLSIMDMGKVDTVGIKVPDGVNHVKIVEMIGEEHADQEIVSEK